MGLVLKKKGLYSYSCFYFYIFIIYYFATQNQLQVE